MISCPLCSAEFDSDRENCHSSCPFNSGCNMLKCPYCDYEFVTESKTVNFFKAIFAKWNKEKHDAATPDR